MLYLFIFNIVSLLLIYTIVCMKFNVDNIYRTACFFLHNSSSLTSQPWVQNTNIHRKVTWIKNMQCSSFSSISRKKTNPTVLGLGLRMPILHCFSGSFLGTATSTPRCTMRRSRRWPAPSTTARIPSTSSKARSLSTTTWTRRL